MKPSTNSNNRKRLSLKPLPPASSVSSTAALPLPPTAVTHTSTSVKPNGLPSSRNERALGLSSSARDITAAGLLSERPPSSSAAHDGASRSMPASATAAGVTYGSFLRRETQSRQREERDMHRNRRESGAFEGGGGGYSYPNIAFAPSIGPDDSSNGHSRGIGHGGHSSFAFESDELLSRGFLPTLSGQKHNDNDKEREQLYPFRNDGGTRRARSVSAVAIPCAFLTETHVPVDSNLTRASKQQRSHSQLGTTSTLLGKVKVANNTILTSSPFRSAHRTVSPALPPEINTAVQSSRRGISALAHHQNRVGERVLAVLFDEKDDHDRGERRVRLNTSSAGANEEEWRERTNSNPFEVATRGADAVLDPMQQAFRALNEFVSVIREGDASSGASSLGGGAATDNRNEGAPHAQGTHASNSGNSAKTGLRPSGGKGSMATSRSKLGPTNTISFVPDAEVEERFREVLALEGLDTDDFFGAMQRGNANAMTSLTSNCALVSSSGNAAGGLNAECSTVNLSDLLDKLSRLTLKEEHKAIYEKINARYIKEEAERRELQRKKQQAELDREATGSVVPTTQTLLKRAGPQGPLNSYALLNEIHRRETKAGVETNADVGLNNKADARPPRPSLIDRFRAAHDPSLALLAGVQGGGGTEGSPLSPTTQREGSRNDGGGEESLTAKMVLMRKMELLRRDKPLRLKFFEHVKSIKTEMRKEQDERSSGVDGTLFMHSLSCGEDEEEEEANGERPNGAAPCSYGSLFNPSSDQYYVPASSRNRGGSRGFSANIEARNVLLAQQMTAEALEEQRRTRSLKRDARMTAARERHNEHQNQRRNRFISLVERARGIGYAYDTGLTDPNALYRFGSEANDIVACWMQFVVLAKSRRVFAEKANAVIANREIHDALSRRKVKEERSAKIVQRWWRKTFNLRRAARHVSSILVVVKYLRSLPKIQCRFRIAMRSLLDRVVRLQRHFRAMFTYRRVRYEHARKTIGIVAKQEVLRIDKDMGVIAKEKRKLELQLQAAIKGRKQHFQDALKQNGERMMDKMKRKEYLLALSESSIAELASLVMGPKERAFKAKVSEFATQANLKFLAAKDPVRVIELQMGYRPPAGLFSFKEQSAIRRILSNSIPRPFESLVLSNAEAQGIIEERGYELGQKDFTANTMLGSSVAMNGAASSTIKR